MNQAKKQMEAYRSGHNGHDWKSCSLNGLRGSNPLASAIKTHAKGAYKTPLRVSFSMQNRGKLPFLWQFTLFVVSSYIAVGICFSRALGNLKILTIAQKGFLHDKERMIAGLGHHYPIVFLAVLNTITCVYHKISACRK